MSSINRTPLPTNLEQAYSYAQKNARIVPWACYGGHIDIKCQHGVQFHTKNIEYIGARSIFPAKFLGGCTADEPCDFEMVVPDAWLDRLIPISICKCDRCGKEICEAGRFSSPNRCHDCFSKQ